MSMTMSPRLSLKKHQFYLKSFLEAFCFYNSEFIEISDFSVDFFASYLQFEDDELYLKNTFGENYVRFCQNMIYAFDSHKVSTAKSILSIFVNFLSFNDMFFIEKLFQTDFATFMNNLFEIGDPRFYQKIFEILRNFFASENQFKDQILNLSNFQIFIIRQIETTNKQVTNSYLDFLNSLFSDCQNPEIKLFLLKNHSLFDSIVKQVFHHKTTSILIKFCKCIGQMLDFGEKMFHNFDTQTNIFLEKIFSEQRIRDAIDFLANKNSDEVTEAFEHHIKERFFEIDSFENEDESSNF